jgi:hypothetical protein
LRLPLPLPLALPLLQCSRWRRSSGGHLSITDFLLYISTYTHALSYEGALVMIDGGGSE